MTELLVQPKPAEALRNTIIQREAELDQMQVHAWDEEAKEEEAIQEEAIPCP
jgi:hypothetical protein